MLHSGTEITVISISWFNLKHYYNNAKLKDWGHYCCKWDVTPNKRRAAIDISCRKKKKNYLKTIASRTLFNIKKIFITNKEGISNFNTTEQNPVIWGTNYFIFPKKSTELRVLVLDINWEICKFDTAASSMMLEIMAHARTLTKSNAPL